MKGTYYVFGAELLEGWTDETLTEALKEPLAEIGIAVEFGEWHNPYQFKDDILPSEQDALIDQIKHIVDKISTSGQ